MGKNKQVMKKIGSFPVILLLILVSLLILSGCQKVNLPGMNPSDDDTETTQNPSEPVTIDPSQVEAAKQSVNIEYCKNEIKISELQVKSAQKKVDKEDSDIKEVESELQQAKALNDQDDVAEKEKQLELAKNALQDAKNAHEQTKVKLNDIVEKCTMLSQKKDKDICSEFTQSITSSLEEAKAALAEDQQDLEKVKGMLDDAKLQNKPVAFIKSIEDELEEENLAMLKNQNKIDKLTSFLDDLQNICG